MMFNRHICCCCFVFQFFLIDKNKITKHCVRALTMILNVNETLVTYYVARDYFDNSCAFNY